MATFGERAKIVKKKLHFVGQMNYVSRPANIERTLEEIK